MSIDVEQIIDVYTTLKEYVPTKDRQAAADHVFSVLSDSGLSERDLKVLAGGDSYLSRASEDYLDPDDDINEDDDDYDYDED